MTEKVFAVIEPDPEGSGSNDCRCSLCHHQFEVWYDAKQVIEECPNCKATFRPAKIYLPPPYEVEM